MADEKPDEFPLLTYLDDLVEGLRRRVPDAAGGEDVGAVHQARVATRRLKAAVELLGPVVTNRHRKPFAKVTRTLRRRLGPLRDFDVMLGHLAEVKPPRHDKAVRWVKARLDHGRRDAVIQAAADLPPPRILARLGTWWGLREEIAAAPAAVGPLLSESVHLQLDAFAEQAQLLVNPPVAATGHVAGRNDPHQLRIAGKSLRYTLEMAKAHGRTLPRAVMASFKRIQEALGLWHDFVVLTERMMHESTADLLAHHDAATQQAVLALAAATLRRAEQQLAKVAAFWARDGERLVRQIRECFPLTNAAEPPTGQEVEPKTEPMGEPALVHPAPEQSAKNTPASMDAASTGSVSAA